MHVFDEMRARLDFGQPARRVDRCLLQQRVHFRWWQGANSVQGMAAVLKELSHERPLEFCKGIADGRALTAHEYLPPSNRIVLHSGRRTGYLRASSAVCTCNAAPMGSASSSTLTFGWWTG